MAKLKVEVWIEDGVGGVDVDHSDDISITREDHDEITTMITQSGVFEMLHGLCGDEQ